MSANKHTISPKIYIPLVWICRIALGAVFILSGFSKAVDPWGFIYKIQEYLNVWGIDWLWRETVTVGATGLAALEFTCGLLLLTGCLRRSICWIVLALMAFMLPLTLYIMVYNPVADCGCFGDAIIISNTATFFKNIGITIAAIFLLYFNHRVPSVFAPLIQWLVMVASVFYCIVLSITGYMIQPMVDFRPYPVGSSLIEDADDNLTLIYERDGERREFDIDNLPDSTWQYVGRNEAQTTKASFAIFDGDDDVTTDVLETSGPQLILFVSDPKTHRKARASMSNNLNTYIGRIGGSMIGVVATPPDSLQSWIETANPDYEVYTSDDTAIKEIVRGDAGLVYLVDGKIVWKRNLYSLPADFPDFSQTNNVLDDISVIDSGLQIKRLTFIYIAILFAIYMLGLVRLRRESKKNKKQEPGT